MFQVSDGLAAVIAAITSLYGDLSAVINPMDECTITYDSFDNLSDQEKCNDLVRFHYEVAFQKSDTYRRRTADFQPRDRGDEVNISPQAMRME